MKKIFLLILGLFVVSMFLVGCSQTPEGEDYAENVPDSVEVMDGDGDLVGEAFRVSSTRYQLAKNKLTMKKTPVIPKIESYNCLPGFDYIPGKVISEQYWFSKYHDENGNEEFDDEFCDGTDYLCDAADSHMDALTDGQKFSACGAGYELYDDNLYGGDSYVYCCVKA
jgi:hypothetical protein